MSFTVFISGVMQGSKQGKGVQSQDYRKQIAAAVLVRHPDAKIEDPWERFPGAMDFGPEEACPVLLQEVEVAAKADVLVAYIPTASMGTALEMWGAYQAGVPVLIITPMTHNWVVWLMAQRTFPTLDAFLDFVAAGELEGCVNNMD